jgi:hypothetical protein
LTRYLHLNAENIKSELAVEYWDTESKGFKQAKYSIKKIKHFVAPMPKR